MYDISPVRRVAMLSVHTSPLAPLGQKKTGGMNVYVRDFTRELARRGIEVDVFTRAVDNNTPSIQFDMGCGCRVVQIPAGPRQTIPNDAIVNYLDEFAQGVLDFTREYGIQYDLVHSHYWLSGLVAGRLRQHWGPIPIVHMYHTLGQMKNRIAQSGSQYVASVRLMGEAQTARIADCLVAATPAEKSQLIELYGAEAKKIVVLSPGVDLNRFNPVSQQIARQRLGIPADEKIVLFVGRIEALKGLDTLLHATGLLQKQQPEILQNTRVVIVGGNPHRPDKEMTRLQQLRLELGLQDVVEFWGARDQSQLPNYYAAADMVVMPSYYESFGMVGLEAMVMGTPLIASRVGGLAYLVQDGVSGFLVPPQNPQALAERILLLLNDKWLRRRLAVGAQRYAQQYDWSNIVSQMMDFYAVLTQPCPVI